ncbi:MAG TPA: hypothetical protein PK733_03055 [Clostridiales bacterium]|nr:hypothetical protein [Clostridiales bacterium]
MKKVFNKDSEPNPGKEVDKMIRVSNELFSRDIMGVADLRKDLSSVMDNAIDRFQEVVTGNVKKGGKTATIISTELLDLLLGCYQFNPLISYDNPTQQYEVLVPEIGASGFGETKQDAIDVLLDNIVNLTEDYFDDIELYIRIEKYKKQYPYYLKLKGCVDKNQLLKVLGLDRKN